MKKAFISLSLFVVVILAFCSCTKNAKIPMSNTDYIGMAYEEVQQTFTDLGFVDISVVPVEDISSKEKESDKTVKSITVNDVKDFSAKDKFPIESKVVIEYHVLKMLSTPLKTEAINNQDYLVVEDLFKKAGFADVSSEKVLDRDVLSFDKQYENEIAINGNTITSLDSEYPYDTKIKIVGHYPFSVVPVNSDSISGYQYQELIDMFIAAGFKNTEPVIVDDLTSDLSDFEGIVSDCSVDDKTEFAKGDKFSNESSVKVTYHIVKMLETPLTNQAYSTRKYSDVEKTLKEIGFTNIKKTEINDLPSIGSVNGIVGSVSFNGSTDYQAKDVFPVDAEIEIEYHTIKKIHPPISSSDIQGKNTKELEKLFADCGFTNIEITAVDDLDPDTEKANTKNEIKIGDTNSFSLNSSFAYDSPISIILHRKYTKYSVDAVFKCVPNLFFSQYDLDVYVDGEKILTVTHGNEKSISLRLKKGVHTITVTKAEAQSVKGETNINVSGEKEVYYTLYCFEKYVSIDTEYDRIKGSVPTTTEPKTTEPKTTTQTPTQKHKASYHSSGDRDIANEGNSGVFTYKQHGPNYDSYIVVDFDNKYVYQFYDGERSAYRTKITSGDLNEGIILTFHEGSTVWQEAIYFKTKNLSWTLILEDKDYYQYQYGDNDYSDTMSILNRKTIIDY